MDLGQGYGEWGNIFFSVGGGLRSATIPGHAGGQSYDTPHPPASGSHCSNVRTLCSRTPPALKTQNMSETLN